MKRIHALAAIAGLAAAAFAGAQFASGAANNQAAFVPIVPCRLLDTRPTSQVGPQGTPVGPQSALTADVYGNNGQCVGVPANATAVAMNVTVLNGTEASFLTVFPPDVDRPTASNLNWQPGQAPTPNKVDVKLASNGKVRFYNQNGSVDVIADIVGYYEPVITAQGTISAVTVRTATITIQANNGGGGSNGQAVAQCPTGMVAIAGGVENPIGVPLNTRSTRPEPIINPTGWFGDVRSGSDLTGQTSTVYAVCITLNL